MHDPVRVAGAPEARGPSSRLWLPSMTFSIFRHRGIWVHHGFLLNQLDIAEAIDHVLDKAQRQAVDTPKRVLVRIRREGWTEGGVKKQAAFWYDRPVRWCEVNVVVGSGEETWARLTTALSAAVVSGSGKKLPLKALV